MSTFGEEIKKFRRNKKFTQKELADEIQKNGLKCDFTYISKIENNRLERPPSEELIEALALILNGIAEEWLAMVGQFSRKQILEAVDEIPEVGVLLRKIQNREFSKYQIEEFLEKANEEPSRKSKE